MSRSSDRHVPTKNDKLELEVQFGGVENNHPADHPVLREEKEKPCVARSPRFQTSYMCVPCLGGLVWLPGPRGPPYPPPPASCVPTVQVCNGTFMHDLTPNNAKTAPKHVSWPQYSLSDPYNIVFDVNKTDLAYTALDNVHKKEIAFLLDDVFANDS
ncbi:hypothetical protein H9Q69_013582 [Fusarium xylarioides]|uniref:Uncharacterized protein n=1 Tax=Fusarium xylarioides TaxID=221167 RepID=A0A9P7HDM0_9HYPO|nr:hypothetical protein H9Q70_012820 [Fusarium xylarioides]KAG5757812.1 hypothetical protein H9Q72_014046 [Fusarium xylarioides]KAG5787346.1 hypothetical protein H9Q69_013582 [Fusarium xylarioides]